MSRIWWRACAAGTRNALSVDGRGDLFAEGGAGAVGARLHRRHVEIELVGDLGLRVAVGEAHTEDRTVLVAERRQAAAGQRERLVGGGLVLRGRSARSEVRGQVRAVVV